MVFSPQVGGSAECKAQRAERREQNAKRKDENCDENLCDFPALCFLVARGMLISFLPIDCGGSPLRVLVARGELILFPIGFAHCPRAVGSTARAATSFAVALPLLAAWFSAHCCVPLEPDEI